MLQSLVQIVDQPVRSLSSSVVNLSDSRTFSGLLAMKFWVYYFVYCISKGKRFGKRRLDDVVMLKLGFPVMLWKVWESSFVCFSVHRAAFCITNTNSFAIFALNRGLNLPNSDRKHHINACCTWWLPSNCECLNAGCREDNPTMSSWVKWRPRWWCEVFRQPRTTGNRTGYDV